MSHSASALQKIDGLMNLLSTLPDDVDQSLVDEYEFKQASRSCITLSDVDTSDEERDFSIIDAAAPTGGGRTMAAPMQKTVTILDGGMGHSLRRLGVSIVGEIGTSQRFSNVAMANVDRPDLVTAAHSAFLKAGAEIITINNYGVVPATLEKPESFDDPELVRVVTGAVENASRARQQQHDDGRRSTARIAASIPPLRASYRPDQVASFEDNLALYRGLVRRLRLTGSSIDFFLCETMSTVDEARAAATAVAEEGGGVPMWVSWTLRSDGRLRSGEKVADAVKAVAAVDLDGNLLQACLFNCCSVEAIDNALDELLAAVPAGCAVGAYPNNFAEEELGVGKTSGDQCSSGEHAHDHGDGDKNEYREDLSPEKFAAVAKNWVDRGCTIIGGCCGCFPEHIQALSTLLFEEIN